MELTKKDIDNRIYTIRGIQVMVDRDLAELYQVETKVLNQAVKRNIERFPETFRFQLSEAETSELLTHKDRLGFLNSQNDYLDSRSQIVTLNEKSTKRGHNIKYLPYVFTEQGVAMLSAVLRSDVAVQVSIQIMNAFVEMRKLMANHSGLLQRMEGIERKQLESDQKFEQIFKALEAGKPDPNQGIFFDGQIFDAYSFMSGIIKKAKKEIFIQLLSERQTVMTGKFIFE
jgi:hypothetical protein